MLTKKESSELGQEINKVLEKIEEDNPEKLEGIFRSIDFNNEANLGRTKERNSMLKHLLELLKNMK